MTITTKIAAFLSYLLLVPGWLFVLIFRRKDSHASFHARQSMLINLLALVMIAAWFVVTWLVVSIPIMGPIFAWFLFAIVITAFIFLAVVWIMGMVRSFRENSRPLPLFGNWARKSPF